MKKPLSILKFIFLSFFLTVVAIQATAQEVTLSYENVPLERILNSIRQQTNLALVFSEQLVDVNRKISIDVNSVNIEDALQLLLRGTNLSYEINNDKLYLLEKDNNQSSDSSPSLKKITGNVVDIDGTPIIGATIVVKGSNEGTITDLNGVFTISASEQSILTISFVGYIKQNIKIGDTRNLNIILEEDNKTLGELVVVGYGVKKKLSITGAISNIKNDDIKTTKSPSLAVALEGKVPGLQIKQQNGMPGEYNTDINIRGMGNPLYVIDGVVRDGSREFQLLNPEDVESISVLKDASAAIYGMNSGNGVIIVETKSGSASAMKISLNSMFGISTPSSNIGVLNVSQYEELVNEANINVGNGPAFSSEELARRQALPSNDWYDAVFKDKSQQQQHSLTITGGSDRISTYIGLGYGYEDGILRSGDLDYKKYTLRSNTKVKIAENLLANVNISAWTDKRTQPGTDDNTFMYLLKQSYNIRPYEPIYANENTDYYNKPTPTNENPVAASYSDLNGYTNWRNSSFQSTVDLTYDIPFVKGLKLKTMVAYDVISATTNKVQKSINLYTYSENDGYTSSSLWQPFVSEGRNITNRLDFQGQVIYDRTFNSDHELSVLGVFESKEEKYSYLYAKRLYDFFTTDNINMALTDGQSNDGYNGQRRYLSYVGRVNYGYKQKYLLELACRYDGSYRYNPDNRWGFFPVVSVGWRASEEKFISSNLPFITNLKIRGSHGKTGQDGGDAFQYMSGYNLTGGYIMNSGTYTNGWEATKLTNEDLTWYTSLTSDIGFDLSINNGIFAMEFDVYRRNRSGLLGTRLQALPNTFGAGLPEENLNKDRTDGIEVLVSHRNKIGEVTYGVSANVNFYRTKTIYQETAPYTSSWDAYRNGTVGRYQDITRLYNVTGRYQDYTEIQNAPINSTSVGNSFLLPGDYIYEDTNGDGLIDSKDHQALRWSGNPKLHYGMTIDLSWKGFDLTMLLQGSALSSVKYNEVLGQVLTFNGNSPAFYYDRWHQADPYDTNSEWISGYWPAIRQGTTNTYNQTDQNTFNRRNTNYLRLKNVDLGYTFNSSLLTRIGIDRLRVYVNGFNLLVFCDEYMKNFDPEISENGGLGYQYPLTRSYNLGFNITF